MTYFRGCSILASVDGSRHQLSLLLGNGIHRQPKRANYRTIRHDFEAEVEFNHQVTSFGRENVGKVLLDMTVRLGLKLKRFAPENRTGWQIRSDSLPRKDYILNKKKKLSESIPFSWMIRDVETEVRGYESIGLQPGLSMSEMLLVILRELLPPYGQIVE